MKILVTGSRRIVACQTVWDQLDQALAQTSGPLIVIHGDAAGADHMAHMWCVNHPEVYEIRVPAKWKLLGLKAGHIRNRVMGELQPDRVLAFYKEGAENKGTSGMVGLAATRGIPVERFWEEEIA